MNKNKKTLLIVGIAVAAIAICLAVFLLPNNESGNGELSWQEQYDLGVRYLSEGNYEEAIIAFTAAIEIDPKKPDTYEKLADVYITLGDIEKARDILEQGANATGEDALRKRFEELQKNGVIVFSNNLNISNLYCYFMADQEIIEGNEGTIGGMNIDFIVDGPSDVRKVDLSTWYPNLPDHAEIADAISGTSDFWKNHQELAGEYKSLPFETSVTHMVWPEDIGETFYVVLVGVNENFDVVGYAVVQEIIDSDENMDNKGDNGIPDESALYVLPNWPGELIDNIVTALPREDSSWVKKVTEFSDGSKMENWLDLRETSVPRAPIEQVVRRTNYDENGNVETHELKFRNDLMTERSYQTYSKDWMLLHDYKYYEAEGKWESRSSSYNEDGELWGYTYQEGILQDGVSVRRKEPLRVHRKQPILVH